MRSKVQWNTSRWPRRWIDEAFIQPMVTATSNILNYTPLHSKSPIALTICLWPSFCSLTMSTNGSPQKTPNTAPPGGLFGSQQHPDDNVEASYNNAGNTPSKDTQFGHPTNLIHPPPGYSYPPSQPPFWGAPQFYHAAPFNMTPSSHPSSAATQGYQSYGPSWQAYDFPQGGYAEPQMFPPQQITGHGPSSPGAPQVPQAPPRNNPVVRPTSSSSTAPGQLPVARGRPPISFPMKRFQPAAEPRRTDVAGIADLPPLPEISSATYDADYESDDLSDLCGAEGKAPISLKQTEFSVKHFAKRIGQPNFSAFNKWKKVWVAGCLEKKHRSIIRGQNRLKQLRDGRLNREMAVADFLETFGTWLALENIDNPGWIRRQWVEMFLMQCGSEVW